MDRCSVALSFTIGIAEGSLEAVYWHSTRIWKQRGRRYLGRCKFPSLGGLGPWEHRSSVWLLASGFLV